jgi:hypothetical protein
MPAAAMEAAATETAAMEAGVKAAAMEAGVKAAMKKAAAEATMKEVAATKAASVADPQWKVVSVVRIVVVVTRW